MTDNHILAIFLFIDLRDSVNHLHLFLCQQNVERCIFRIFTIRFIASISYQKISFANSDSFIVILIFCIKSAMIFTKITQNIFAIVKKEGVLCHWKYLWVWPKFYSCISFRYISNNNTQTYKRKHIYCESWSQISNHYCKPLMGITFVFVTH